MAVVIGNNTTVSFAGTSAYCALSANWGYNPNPQRLYCLGSWEPAYTYNKPVETLSLVFYAGGDVQNAPSKSVVPDNTCRPFSNSSGADIAASVSPGICPAGSVAGPSSAYWYITGYSYTKDDANLPGQETWSLQQWVTGGDSSVTLPTYMIRGISEGTASLEGSSTVKTGVIFSLAAGNTTTSTTGNVSAGGVGKADAVRAGVVTTIGNPTAATGDIVTGNTTVPYTPLYI